MSSKKFEYYRRVSPVWRTLELPKRQQEPRPDDPTHKHQIILRVSGIVHLWTQCEKGDWITPCGHHLRFGGLATQLPNTTDRDCPICQYFWLHRLLKELE